MTLEDDFCDIIKKARHGQGLSVTTVTQQAHLSVQDLQELESGRRAPTRADILALSQALNLCSAPLEEVALEKWLPKDSPAWIVQEGLVTTILGNIGGYEVKGYILADSSTQQAFLIDTGYNAKEMLSTLKQRNLRLTGIGLTHGHTDHAGGLDRLLETWPVPVYLGKGDIDLLPWKPPSHALKAPSHTHVLSVGKLTVECLATPGHTPGGFCYRLHREGQPICFVGDTLFAGSIGRSNPFSLYPTHLASVRDIVLQLPLETVLFPGHGPATTVTEERRYNPFAQLVPPNT